MRRRDDITGEDEVFAVRFPRGGAATMDIFLDADQFVGNILGHAYTSGKAAYFSDINSYRRDLSGTGMSDADLGDAMADVEAAGVRGPFYELVLDDDSDSVFLPAATSTHKLNAALRLFKDGALAAHVFYPDHGQTYGEWAEYLHYMLSAEYGSVVPAVEDILFAMGVWA